MHAKEIGLRMHHHARINGPKRKKNGLTHRAYGGGHDDKELKNIPDRNVSVSTFITMCTPPPRKSRTDRN
jgi:hypothetical protein